LDDSLAEAHAMMGIYKATLFDWRIGIVHAKAGRRNDAQRVLRKLEEHCRHHYCTALDFAELYFWLGEKEKSLKFFEKAIDDRDPDLLNIISSPAWDPIASEPSFQTLLKKMNLD